MSTRPRSACTTQPPSVTVNGALVGSEHSPGGIARPATARYGGRGSELRLDHGRRFFGHHAVRFAPGEGAAGGKPGQPQRHNALSLEAKSRSLNE
jgi:hypothetical protein